MENPQKPISRNVILDLLPAYIAGEASADSRVLVEAFAQNDPEIARLIRSGELDSGSLAPEVSPPDDLEMKTMKRIRRSIRRQMMYVALGTAAILLVPLVAMRFSSEVNWTPFDFMVMGLLLGGTGLAYVLIARISDSIAYRAAIGLAVVAGFLLTWVNLAVGIIGSEDNPANVLYLGVLIVGIVGAGKSRFQAGGMALTMFAIAAFQMLVPVIAMMVWRSTLDEPPGITGVFMLNGFFAAMFAVSGLLFRHASRKQPGS